MPSNEPQTEINAGVRRSLTIAELGVIISLVCSVGSLLFTAGIVYGDVQRNTDRIGILEPKVDQANARIERIDANVQFLVDQMRADRPRPQ